MLPNPSSTPRKGNLAKLRQDYSFGRPSVMKSATGLGTHVVGSTLQVHPQLRAHLKAQNTKTKATEKSCKHSLAKRVHG